MSSPEKIAFAIAVGLFACGTIGFVLQRMLPEKHTTGPPRDMVKAIVDLLTLLSALTLGLLIWTSYGVFAGQNAAIQTLAAKVLQLDVALADYGPDANGVRLQFREALGKTIAQVWGSDVDAADLVAHDFEEALRNIRARQAALDTLHPSTDEQRQALTAAKSAIDAIGQSRLQMSFALSAPVSYRWIPTRSATPSTALVPQRKSRVSPSAPPPSARFPGDQVGSARRNIEPLQ
jgi:hypothetical protein